MENGEELKLYMDDIVFNADVNVLVGVTHSTWKPIWLIRFLVIRPRSGKSRRRERNAPERMLYPLCILLERLFELGKRRTDCHRRYARENALYTVAAHITGCRTHPKLLNERK